MDDAPGVRKAEGIGNLPDPELTFLETHSRARHTPVEGIAINKLHGGEDVSFRLAVGQDRDDVGMLELADELGLAAEALDKTAVSADRWGEDLDRHLGARALIHRAVHGCHASLPNRGLNVIVLEGLTDERAQRLLHVKATTHHFECKRGNWSAPHPLPPLDSINKLT